ncbi:mannose-1-phosphate guanylyltransferase/mannose-6-phosphate isomerase [Pseudomonas gingeri]|uniref:mannose-1-phosphate guanylyltransferase/mannose-6-phosphate isomerase n=1 Tax=Pseudomonas gingeri TaxID=117681 RepID=UPI0015A1686C|nr:mannose-1-phosphate guanylyltransferase/mannose-6-phosphate isomerase [Pseudomonas gingeri]NWE45771.1 mannose-1-phosphate guanylyltransferase/mannose-6-phosphate isomerase [Pseudomonas gingeri]
MTFNSITPVVLCGGSGSRLWPLSRKSFPKQFVPLIGGKSLLQLTLERVSAFADQVMMVAAEEHRFLVSESLQSTGVGGSIILEPCARNTAPAMALAALQCEREGRDLLLFCPADHHIPNVQYFAETVSSGISEAEAGAIVTFGIVPSFPSTAYGYIEQGVGRLGSAKSVEKFIEKPDLNSAEQLLLAGNVLWNAGIFLCKASTLISALEEQAPDILTHCRASLEAAASEVFSNSTAFIRPQTSAFSACRAQSIDYAVMEHHDNVAVIPFNSQWSDVGSWNSLAELTDADEAGNRVYGQGTVRNSSNTFVHAPHRPVVALGTDNLLIVDTLDAVLITHRNNVEQVKDVVAQLEKEKCSEAISHRKVSRPWGWYDSIDRGERFQVKRIGVKPGASLSLQKHHHRAEHWIVVKGTAEVTRGNDTFLLSENQSTYIPVGEMHRLKNPGVVELEIIEVQSGSYLGENDIVRFEDNYGRAND